MADQGQRSKAQAKMEDTKQCANQKLGQAQQSAKSMAGTTQEKVDEAGKTVQKNAEAAKEHTGSLLQQAGDKVKDTLESIKNNLTGSGN